MPTRIPRRRGEQKPSGGSDSIFRGDNRHLGTGPPRWAAYKPYTRMMDARVRNVVSGADKAEPEDWFVPGS